MKIYRYWQLAEAQTLIQGTEVVLKCYGGSNVSPDDAQQQARAKLERVKRKIAGDRHAFDDYEVEIREEVVTSWDECAVITRNRYGAQVLNAADLMIVDIDQPPFSFWDLFIRPRPDAVKERIISRVRRLAEWPRYHHLGLRLYETKNGIRVIVLGGKYDPRSDETLSMLKDFNCDALYARLCRRQGCFRARLTPKPHNLRLRRPPCKFPRRPEEEADFQKWLMDYEAASGRFRVCRFIEQIGPGMTPESVRRHDELCGVERDLPLA